MVLVFIVIKSPVVQKKELRLLSSYFTLATRISKNTSNFIQIISAKKKFIQNILLYSLFLHINKKNDIYFVLSLRTKKEII